VEKDQKDVTNEIKELTKRISELESMLAALLKPFNDARKTTERYPNSQDSSWTTAV